jgi:acyl-coenzyme A thioesterase PaaI-like protein
MTDLPTDLTAVPARLGATALLDERGLVVELEPRPEELHHGVLRLSVLTFLVDVSAGVALDTDPSAWTFTTDLSLRMRPVPAPSRVSASTTILRQGRRSAHGLVTVVDGHGGDVAAGAIGFAHVPRKAHDPPKPAVAPQDLVERFGRGPRLTSPLREEAGIVALDPANGVIELAVRPEVCNPAGTLQGAMVALAVEAATEDLVATRFERAAVVTELDIRYLAQANVGPVRSRCRVLDDGPDAGIEVQLVDTGVDRITTVAYARASAAAPTRSP